METEQENVKDAVSEFEGNSLLTRPDAEGADDAGNASSAAGEDEKEKSPRDAIPDKPEGYDLKFDENTQVDRKFLGDFQKTAHTLGISRNQAQKLAALYEAHAAGAEDRAEAARRQAMESAKTKWEDEIEKRPAFALERDQARAALRRYGTRELYALMDQTNIGSHPEMWTFLANVGKALAEPGFRGESAEGGPKSAADVLYPNQGK